VSTIDLDDLERKARTAIGAQYEFQITEDGSESERLAYVTARLQLREHAMATRPPVTLALIARIRELEAELKAERDEARDLAYEREDRK